MANKRTLGTAVLMMAVPPRGLTRRGIDFEPRGAHRIRKRGPASHPMSPHRSSTDSPHARRRDRGESGRRRVFMSHDGSVKSEPGATAKVAVHDRKNRYRSRRLETRASTGMLDLSSPSTDRATAWFTSMLFPEGNHRHLIRPSPTLALAAPKAASATARLSRTWQLAWSTSHAEDDSEPVEMVDGPVCCGTMKVGRSLWERARARHVLDRHPRGHRGRRRLFLRLAVAPAEAISAGGVAAGPAGGAQGHAGDGRDGARDPRGEGRPHAAGARPRDGALRGGGRGLAAPAHGAPRRRERGARPDAGHPPRSRGEHAVGEPQRRGQPRRAARRARGARRRARRRLGDWPARLPPPRGDVVSRARGWGGCRASTW